MQMCCQELTYENPRWRLRPEIVKPSVRNNTFVKFQRLYLYVRWRPIQRMYAYARHSWIRLGILENMGIAFEIAQMCYSKTRL